MVRQKRAMPAVLQGSLTNNLDAQVEGGGTQSSRRHSDRLLARFLFSQWGKLLWGFSVVVEQAY